MIVSFSIQNFRSIKDKVTLSFEPDKSDNLAEYYLIDSGAGEKLLKLGLIYGANGSGKTTVLKALDFLRSLVLLPVTQKQEKLNFKPFLFDVETVLQESVFELTFIYNGVKYYYEIGFTTDAVLHEKMNFYSPNKSLVFERTTDTDKQLAFIKFGDKINIKKAQEDALTANTLWNATVFSGFLKSNVDSKELRDATDWFGKVLRNLIEPSTNLTSSISKQLESKSISSKRIIQFLDKADFRISNIHVEKETVPTTEEFRELMQLIVKQVKASAPTIKMDDFTTRDEIHIAFEHEVYHDGKKMFFSLPYKDESEGTQRYFQFSGLLDQMLSHPCVRPIDELEASLHPDLLKHFLLLFLVNVKNSQLIATTHYRELLLEKDILREDIIWFTEKKPDGSMELFSLNEFDSSVVRDTTSIFNAYRSGKLGAVPNLNNYYLESEDGQE
ncbi:ATP/GTP-binding protein [Mucilaginibacter sp. AK015]|uniref:AAA family ATPase n=1 Tax=Mucilaginibacter sp. AK015 TaxID=2723072 RepID=UPI00160FF099|nr:ATP-binding protein [Mucilaginibacter sp. AK015]MBB5395325.1 AAA15 family ATPase/GTPase [Mucilaginibacter sp. AK015]